MAEGLHELVRARRSIRQYADRPVPPDVLARLLTAAIWAPSAHNRQPWRFVVLTAPDVKAALAQAMGERLRSDRLADGDPPADVEADRARSFARLTGAPAVIVAGMTIADMDHYQDPRRSQAEHTMAVQSVAMAIQNLLLASHAEGLGACWMCAPLFCAGAVRDVLGLPVEWQAQAVVTVGYPAGAGKPAQRRALSEVVHWR